MSTTHVKTDEYYTKLSELFDKIMEKLQVHCGATLNVEQIKIKFRTIKSENELYDKTSRFKKCVETVKNQFENEYLHLYFDMVIDYLSTMLNELK